MATLAAPVIEIESLLKDYKGLRPLRLTGLSVREGERVAVGGIDATAAEVLVNLINGAILPDTGHVRVFGEDTASIADEDAWLASLERFGIVTPRAVLLDGVDAAAEPRPAVHARHRHRAGRGSSPGRVRWPSAWALAPEHLPLIASDVAPDVRVQGAPGAFARAAPAGPAVRAPDRRRGPGGRRGLRPRHARGWSMRKALTVARREQRRHVLRYRRPAQVPSERRDRTPVDGRPPAPLVRRVICPNSCSSTSTAR